MLFNSYVFVLLFLPVVLALYFLLNKYKLYKCALGVLFLASVVFYAYNNIKYVLILLVSIVVNWCISRLMQKQRYAKWILAMGIILNVGSIFYFKYFDFFIKNMNHLLGTSFHYLNLMLPLGISFYTFQQISYLVDSYRGETADYTFLEYATFVSFFPQLVAGPIVLHGEIISQFKDKEKKTFSHDSFAAGIYAFAIGLFKKVLIADTLGVAVDFAWKKIDYLTAVEIIVIMLSYTFQIYFDFSGYSDMAIGLGKMFRIELPINFNSPYKATSIIDFWSRWHMTLTRFLRQYVYFPLGGNRKGVRRTYINILVVFLVSGIWHGANWTFILWGAIHGVANVMNRMFAKMWDKLHQVIRWGCTFVFINFTWLLFRSTSVEQAINLLKRILLLKSIEISLELKQCYMLKEFMWIEKIPIFSKGILEFPGFCMWSAIFLSLVLCLCFSNVHENEFKPTIGKAILTPILLVWTIMSFAGVSTFLYFNF